MTKTFYELLDGVKASGITGELMLKSILGRTILKLPLVQSQMAATTLSIDRWVGSWPWLIN